MHWTVVYRDSGNDRAAARFDEKGPAIDFAMGLISRGNTGVSIRSGDAILDPAEIARLHEARQSRS